MHAMRSVALLVLLVGGCAFPAWGQISGSSGSSRSIGNAVIRAFSEQAFSTSFASSTRLNPEQLKALIQESPTASNLYALVQLTPLGENARRPELNCELYLPLEPGEVSYFSGTKVKRTWLQNPSPELRAQDELQCAICQAKKSGNLDPAEAEIANKMLVDILSDVVDTEVRNDLGSSPYP